MKTTKHLQILRSYIKTVLISAMLIASTLDSSAQNPFLSFQIARDISGSGLGGNVCPSISLNFNKSTISLGPNFQRRKMNFSGIQANYRYSVATNYNEKLELYFSGNFTVQTSAYMSKGNVEIEKSCHSEGVINYAELRYKVIEGYAGIGLKVNPTKNLSAGFSAGLGVFDTLNKNYDREMYRQKSGFVLQTRFVLIYSFKTKN
jgi:hypothetical protein